MQHSSHMGLIYESRPSFSKIHVKFKLFLQEIHKREMKSILDAALQKLGNYISN